MSLQLLWKGLRSFFCQFIQTGKVGQKFSTSRLGTDCSKVSSTYSKIFLFILTGTLMGSQKTSSALAWFTGTSLEVKIVRSWNFSNTFLEVKFPVNRRMEHNVQFCLFFWLTAISSFIFDHRYIVLIEILLFKQLLNLKRMVRKILVWYLLPKLNGILDKTLFVSLTWSR